MKYIPQEIEAKVLSYLRSLQHILPISITFSVTMNLYVHTCMCVHVCIHIYTCAHMCICVCRERERGRVLQPQSSLFFKKNLYIKQNYNSDINTAPN